MPSLIRLIVLNFLSGACIGWGLAGAILIRDVQGIASLVAASSTPGAGLTLIALASGATFGLGSLATALLSSPHK